MCSNTATIMKDDKPEALRRNRSRNRNGNGNSSPLSGATTIKTGHHHTHTVANGEKNSSRSKEASMERGKLSRDRKPTRELHEYDTPFDKSGRCHYHVNVQLATKKFNGGWHILFQVCPKCMEQKPTTTKIVRKDSSRNGSSTHFTRSSSRGMGGGGGGGGGGDAHGQFDSNGCCILHSHVQVATKKILGGGWKVRSIMYNVRTLEHGCFLRLSLHYVSDCSSYFAVHKSRLQECVISVMENPPLLFSMTMHTLQNLESPTDRALLENPHAP